CATSIIDALGKLHALTNRPNLIVITRGGGSADDLLPYNEESLVRAIAASQIPIVTAIGHEVDTSLADFAADYRCATPSIAATVTAGRYPDLVSWLPIQITGLGNQLTARCQAIRQDAVNMTSTATRALVSYQQEIQNRSALIFRGLELVSPLRNLARGFSITRSSIGSPIQSVNQVKTGDPITISMSDGLILARVNEIQNNHSE
ncbi:hypothetical protein EBR96_07615, partial [bacterium]|nr:hypothetical protein [bacterium]